MNECHLKPSIISLKNFTEQQFKEVIRSDCLYTEGGSLTFPQHIIEKKALMN